MALASAYVHYRHSAVLVAKQSYTSVGAALQRMPPRRAEGALLASTPAFVRALAAYAATLAPRFPDPAWAEWADICARLEAVAHAQIARGGAVPAANAMLNDLDLQLAGLIDKHDDVPIVTDIHTCPAEGQVVEIALGLPQSWRIGTAVGAVLPVVQFKQPLADRLTDAQWASRLEA